MRALAIEEAAHGKYHPDVAITLTNLGNACGALGQPDLHRKCLERALCIQTSQPIAGERDRRQENTCVRHYFAVKGLSIF